jgi:ABC-type transport system involved in cytochrome bd biosynthesis fused ATPase/permease subunit
MEFFPALAVLVLAPEVYFPLRNAASLFHASADGGAALGELNDLTRTKSTTPNGSEVISRVDSLDWDSWSSPFGSGSLESQTLKSGEIILLRGGSGLGKTTFLNSLLGLNENSTARINGVATKAIERSSLFRQVGWIPQSPSLISGSIRDLFTLVRPEMSDGEIEKVLARVGLTVASFPDGLETVIGGLGEKSGHLSGGQKRRIAIARAIAINPSLIIADEPTADLDPSSAQEILNLLRAQADGGAIVIAVLHAPDQVIPGAREEVMVEG